jgi:hypothetical protein
MSESRDFNSLTSQLGLDNYALTRLAVYEKFS